MSDQPPTRPAKGNAARAVPPAAPAPESTSPPTDPPTPQVPGGSGTTTNAPPPRSTEFKVTVTYQEMGGIGLQCEPPVILTPPQQQTFGQALLAMRLILSQAAHTHTSGG